MQLTYVQICVFESERASERKREKQTFQMSFSSHTKQNRAYSFLRFVHSFVKLMLAFTFARNEKPPAFKQSIRPPLDLFSSLFSSSHSILAHFYSLYLVYLQFKCIFSNAKSESKLLLSPSPSPTHPSSIAMLSKYTEFTIYSTLYAIHILHSPTISTLVF